MSTCDFTYQHLYEIFRLALDTGYQVLTVDSWFAGRFDKRRKVLINRVDVDSHLERIPWFERVFNALGIPASFYFRLNAHQYNLLTFDAINQVKALAASGHEIGLHCEIEDMAYYCGLDPAEALRAQIDLFDQIFGLRLRGVASHGDITPRNNLLFWQRHSPLEFGLAYEAYNPALFDHSRYISDSGRTSWKAYSGGQLLSGDSRCVCEHIREGVNLLYVLTHTCYHFSHYVYETIPSLRGASDNWPHTSNEVK